MPAPIGSEQHKPRSVWCCRGVPGGWVAACLPRRDRGDLALGSQEQGKVVIESTERPQAGWHDLLVRFNPDRPSSNGSCLPAWCGSIWACNPAASRRCWTCCSKRSTTAWPPPCSVWLNGPTPFCWIGTRSEMQDRAAAPDRAIPAFFAGHSRVGLDPRRQAGIAPACDGRSALVVQKARRAHLFDATTPLFHATSPLFRAMLDVFSPASPLRGTTSENFSPVLCQKDTTSEKKHPMSRLGEARSDLFAAIVDLFYPVSALFAPTASHSCAMPAPQVPTFALSGRRACARAARSGARAQSAGEALQITLQPVRSFLPGLRTDLPCRSAARWRG